MDCPFCGKEMKEGKIPSALRWVEDGQDDWEGVALSTGLLGGAPKSFYCPGCRQIILPVPETERLLEKLGRKLDAAGEKIEAVQKQWETRRTQAKKQKKKEKLGSKDPWEL